MELGSCCWNRRSVLQESCRLRCQFLRNLQTHLKAPSRSKATTSISHDPRCRFLVRLLQVLRSWLVQRTSVAGSRVALQRPPHGDLPMAARVDGVRCPAGRSVHCLQRSFRALPLGATWCSCNAAKLTLAAELHPSASSLSRRGCCGNLPFVLPAHDLTYAQVVQA
jgi:hypothetical protein